MSKSSSVTNVEYKAEEKPEVDVEAASAGEEDEQDGVFGQAKDGDVVYTSVGFLGSFILMAKTQIGLGVLTIPSVFSTLGVVPGIIVILSIAIMSTFSGYIMGAFKMKHKSVFSVGDVGHILAGPIGREAVGLLYLLLMVFIAGAAFLAVSISLNAVSSHATCTMVFVAIATIAAALVASLQTLHRISYISWIGVFSIIAAVITLTIGVGIQGRPPNAPVDAIIRSVAFSDPTFAEIMVTCGNVVFAYAGTPAFLNVTAEMRDPRQYTKAMLLCQGFITVIYLVVGGVVYHYAGTFVTSPALGTAGPTIKIVCYALAIPGLMASAIIFTHMAAKYIFVRSMRNSVHFLKNSKTHYAVWIGAVAAVAAVGFLLAAAIPAFGGLIGVVGSVLGSFFVFILPGWMWFFDRPAEKRRYDIMFFCTAFMISAGFFLVVAGTYGSVSAIIDSLAGLSGPFSCADNSV